MAYQYSNLWIYKLMNKLTLWVVFLWVPGPWSLAATLLLFHGLDGFTRTLNMLDPRWLHCSMAGRQVLTSNQVRGMERPNTFNESHTRTLESTWRALYPNMDVRHCRRRGGGRAEASDTKGLVQGHWGTQNYYTGCHQVHSVHQWLSGLSAWSQAEITHNTYYLVSF